jgi:hypothetical protein
MKPLMKLTRGTSSNKDAETVVQNVSGRGMWGVPALFIPVPGGDGTASHSHLGSATPSPITVSASAHEHNPPAVLG